LSVRCRRREEVELLRDVAAEIEAEEYGADSEAALRIRQASLTKDQTQLLDSSLPMKNVGAGNPMSLPSAPAGPSRWESGGFGASGGAGTVVAGGSNNGGGVSKGPREPSAVRALKAVDGIKTVDACHVRSISITSALLLLASFFSIVDLAFGILAAGCGQKAASQRVCTWIWGCCACRSSRGRPCIATRVVFFAQQRQRPSEALQVSRDSSQAM
jgi:hypothetical protein